MVMGAESLPFPEHVVPHGRRDWSCDCGQSHCVDCGEVYPCSRRHRPAPSLMGLLGGREHARQYPGHRVRESLEIPWECLDCEARSDLYGMEKEKSL